MFVLAHLDANLHLSSTRLVTSLYLTVFFVCFSRTLSRNAPTRRQRALRENPDLIGFGGVVVRPLAFHL